MRRVIALGIAASLLTAACGGRGEEFATGQERPKISWSLSYWGTPRPGSANVEELSRLVSERTGGRFNINIVYGEALSKARENLDGIKLGAFEMAIFCNIYHPGKNPGFMAVSLPFLPLDDVDVFEKVMRAFYRHPAILDEMAAWNALPYISGLLPQYEIIGRGDPPLTLSDWKGKRIRASGGLGEAIGKLGASKTSVPGPEVYTLLDRGAIDGVAFPSTYAFFSYNLVEISEWYTTNLSLGVVECPIVINRDAYADLPEGYRQVLEDVKTPVYAAQKKTYADVDAKNFPVIQRELRPITYADVELDRFREVAGRPVWEEWIAANEGVVPAKELLDFIFSEALNAKPQRP